MGVRNIDKLSKAINSLPAAIEKNVLARALVAGAGVTAMAVRARIRSNPSIDTGVLLSAVGVAARPRSKRGGVVVSVGILTGKGKVVVRKGHRKGMYANPAKYAHLVEYGTKHSPAEPFLRPALDDSGDAAVGAMLATASELVEQEIAKAAVG